MASEAIGLDDIIATLMTMGFDFKDCQDAITCGKLTVQAAVEWILSGKPNNLASDQPTLRLHESQASNNEGDSSNPFIERNVASLTEQKDASPTTSTQSDIDISDDTVISRSHLSDKQQQIKKDFEEKERIAARKKVQDDKRKQKLDKERILKEIQADRDKQKLTKQQKADNSGQPKPAESNPLAVSTSLSSSDETKVDDKALIQVRLPSGQNFRQTFPATATLGSVWDVVYNRLQRAMVSYQGFIQPFPRREFSREDMKQTLKDLGLTPSGSLVLKQKEAEQATVEDPSSANGVEAQSNSPLDLSMDQGGNVEMQPARLRNPRIEPEFNNNDEPMSEGEDQDPDNDLRPQERMDIPDVGQHMDDDRWMGEHSEDEEEGQDAAFQGFGMRLVPEGVPADDGHHLNRRAADMAARAAAQRFAQFQPVVPVEPARSHSELRFNAHSLQDISMLMLSRRITDPRTPIFSLSGLSNELLETFLTYLKKEKLLSPRILLLMPSYLLKLNLDFYPYTTNELLHASRVLVNLHLISLNSCPLITDAGLLSLKGMKVLKSLSLLNCSQITDCCFAAVSELPLLQSLNLEGTKVTTSGVSKFASSGSCPHISHLNLNRTAVTHLVLSSLAKFEHLKSLYLKQNRMSSLSGLESIVSLESVDVSQTDIVSDSFLCVVRLPHLRHLYLTETQQVHGDTALSYLQGLMLSSIALPCRTSTTDIGMSYITGFSLSALDLTNYTHVGDAGMLSVGQITSLKTLLLTNTRVTDNGIAHLAGLVNLEVLLVDKTLLSNSGVAVIQNFKNLAELSLAATSITSDLLKAGVLNSCSMLSKLNLSRTSIGDRGLQCLKLPNLTLLNLDCTRAHEYIEKTVRQNCPSIKHITLASLSTVPEDEI